MAAFQNDYKVVRGSAYFAAFRTDGTFLNTQTPGGEAFFGDVMAMSATQKATQLDHYQSTGGVKTIDQSATIQNDSSGALTTENISVANLSLFFFGTAQSIAQTVQTIASEAINNVVPGLYYQVGMTATDPTGNRALDSTQPVVVTNDAGSPTTYVNGTDYTFDYLLGRVNPLVGGAITVGTNLRVSYKTKAATKQRVISGSTPIEGALRFLSANSTGTDKDWYIPWAKLTPNGSYELIGDKFATLVFDLKILQKAGLPALYIDGRAA